MTVLADPQPQPQPLLQVRGLEKSFPGVRALSDVDLDVRAGEVHALVGQNGAGKSTLIKVLAGVYQADGGTVLMDGVDVSGASAPTMTTKGLAVIHQDLNLVPVFDVAENMFLGLRQPTRFGIIDRRARSRLAQEMLDRLDTDVRADQAISELSVPQQQMVVIARALLLDARIMVMDEPTAALGAHEVELVYNTVNRLRDQGTSVIYVSHRLGEISDLADRVSVMRDGRMISTLNRSEVADRDHLVRLIVGRSEKELVRAEAGRQGEKVLSLRGVSWRNRVHDADLDIHSGQVTGIAGLVGSGRSELAALMFGATRPDSGTVTINGKVLKQATPAAGIRAGVALLPQDRRADAAFVDLTLRENFTISALAKFRRSFLMDRTRERRAFDAAAERMKIVARGAETKMNQLSGGNQQKVVLGKWLETGADVLVLDEPTQGVDVGAQEQIHSLVRDLAREGKAVVFISSDLDETLRISDRIVVMREGRLVGELGHEATIDEVLALCFGTAVNDIPIAADFEAATSNGATP